MAEAGTRSSGRDGPPQRRSPVGGHCEDHQAARPQPRENARHDRRIEEEREQHANGGEQPEIRHRLHIRHEQGAEADGGGDVRQEDRGQHLANGPADGGSVVSRVRHKRLDAQHDVDSGRERQNRQERRERDGHHVKGPPGQNHQAGGPERRDAHRAHDGDNAGDPPENDGQNQQRDRQRRRQNPAGRFPGTTIEGDIQQRGPGQMHRHRAGGDLGNRGLDLLNDDLSLRGIVDLPEPRDDAERASVVAEQQIPEKTHCCEEGLSSRRACISRRRRPPA